MQRRRLTLFSLLGSLLLAALVGCAQLETRDSGFEGKPYRFEIDDETVEIAIRSGQAIPFKDFIKLAERTSGRVFVYKKSEIETGEGVQFIGTMRMQRDQFYEFFQTMMKVKGFNCVQRPDGSIVEITRA